MGEMFNDVFPHVQEQQINVCCVGPFLSTAGRNQEQGFSLFNDRLVTGRQLDELRIWVKAE